MTPSSSADNGYVDGNGAPARELAAMSSSGGRHLNMVSLEGEFAFGYTRLSGEVTRDSIQTATGHAVATEWFVQGVQSLTPRWFVAGRQEGANAPPQFAGSTPPTLRVSEVTVGYRVSKGVHGPNRVSPAARPTSAASRTSKWARHWCGRVAGGNTHDG